MNVWSSNAAEDKFWSGRTDRNEQDPEKDRLRRPISMKEVRDLYRSFQQRRPFCYPEPMRKLFHEWGISTSSQEEVELHQLLARIFGISLPQTEPLTADQLACVQECHKRANRAIDYLRNRYFEDLARRGQVARPSQPNLSFRTDGLAPGDEIWQKIQHNSRQLSLISIVSIPYGAIHLSAWNAHFPSTTECWMWRVCALNMVALPVVVAVMGISWMLSEKFVPEQLMAISTMHREESVLEQVTGIRTNFLWIPEHFFSLFVTGLGLASMAGCYFGHGYILVEALISLRSPPAGTYQGIEWSSYVPHLG